VGAAQVAQPGRQPSASASVSFSPARSTYAKQNFSPRLRPQSSSARRRRAKFQTRFTGMVRLRASSVVALRLRARRGRGSSLDNYLDAAITRPEVLTVMRPFPRPRPAGGGT